MDFAADAVMDVVAPPTRVGGAKSAAAADADAPTFDDHLAAATQEDAPAETHAAQAATDETHAGADTLESGDSAEAVAIAPVAAQPATQPPQPSLPLLVQFIASDAPMPTQTDVAPTAQAPVSAAAPTTPQTAAPEVAAPTQPTNAAPADAAAPAAPQTQADSDTPATPASAQRDNGAQQAAPQQQAQNTTPVATAPTAQTVATPATPAVTTTAEAAVQAVAPSANATAPVAQTSATREAAMPRSGKSNATHGEEKFEVASRDPRVAPAPNAGVKQGPKTQPGPSTTKEGMTIATAATDTSTSLPQASSATAIAPSTAQAASQTQHVAVDYAAARAPAAHQVGREIIRQFDGDTTRFELRLDPPELGRVEVKLEVSRDHRVTAVISADSPQALTELARNARELEQMLQSAGLELGDSGLSFDLRQGGEGAQSQDGGNGSRSNAQPEAQLEQIAPQARPLGYERWRGVRVDVMV